MEATAGTPSVQQSKGPDKKDVDLLHLTKLFMNNTSLNLFPGDVYVFSQSPCGPSAHCCHTILT